MTDDPKRRDGSPATDMTETALMPAEAEDEQALITGDLAKYLGEIRSRAEALKRLAVAAIRSTRATHWVDYDGRPYLTGAGAEWIARLLGARIRCGRPIREDHEDDAGHWYTVHVECTVEVPGLGEGVTVTGVASSRDRYLGSYLRRDGSLTRDPEAVSYPDIVRKAETSGIRRALVILLGLGDVTWEHLQQILGMDPREQVQGVRFRKGGKK